MKIFVLAMAIVALLVAGCATYSMRPASVPTTRNFVVQLQPKVNASKNDLQIKTKPQGVGKNGRKDGYVGFGEDESGFIVLTLKGEEPGDRCPGAADPGTANWVISRVDLSASGDPDTEKGDAFGESQPDWLALAFPDVDLDDGSVFAADPGEEGTTTVVLDDNNGQEGERFIYYRVTAQKCGGAPGDVAVTDPMVRNTGK